MRRPLGQLQVLGQNLQNTKRLYLLSFLIHLVSSEPPTFCRGVDCDRFQCSSEPFLFRPIDPYLRPVSTFQSPCSCLSDWNQLFCNQTQLIINSPTAPSLELPTVCICRKFSDNNSKCHQFISRCFKKYGNECSCCFNQPRQHCNHLRCQHGEPVFSSANTSCVCHHNVADYPYHICKGLFPRGLNKVHQVIQESAQAQASIQFLGVSIPHAVLWYIAGAIALLLIVGCLILLITSNRKQKKRRAENFQQTQAVNESLLRQRQEDDRYLPSV